MLAKQLETKEKRSKESTEMQIRGSGNGMGVADASSGLGALGQLGQLAGERLVETIIEGRPLGIKAVQIIYNMEFSRKMVNKITSLALEIKGLTKFKNGRYIVQDKEVYLSHKNNLIETYEVFEDLRKKFLNDSKFRKALSTRVAIIEFVGEGDKRQFLEAYGKQAVTLFKRLKEKLLDKCLSDHNTIIFKGSIPEIVRAPEPSDVIWENCEKKESLCRMLLIYFITFVFIMISLGIMVALEYGQSVLAPPIDAMNNSTINGTSTPATATSSGESISTLVNIIVSIVMQIVNALLWVSLSVLLGL